ncbi:guanosine monophosphate reductase [Sphingomonas ginsenosidivorax]|uniref:Guanosine monophosphate reductase n=1 Tax=Sphingomonas ginsenosidivorax TaxID=862135 RepID=A0A5C6UL90_9SPHN|nr:guanosine monophosphate reductase [Sphingomonas ginsenosidivorax]
MGLSFDDVLLVPRRNRLRSRRDVDTAMQLTPGIRLAVPIVSANTPWCTAAPMATAMARAGGIGIVHRMWSPQDQAEAVAATKAAAAGDTPHATLDLAGRLRVGGAVGIKGDYLERADRLADAGVDILAIDVAHGHSDHVIAALLELKARHPQLDCIVGNVATADGARDLIDAGADAIKVGIGPGSVCTTRVVTGAGMPQLTAILECAAVARKAGVGVIADGGIRGSGDIAKAIAAGASAVMLGKLLAGADESEARAVEHDGRRYKVTTGFVTLGVDLTLQRLAGATISRDAFDAYLPEGVEGTFDHSGPVADTLGKLARGLCSGVTYSGCAAVAELADHARFVRVSNAGHAEGRPHVRDGVPALHPDYAQAFVAGPVAG